MQRRPEGFPFFNSGDVIIRSNLAASLNQTVRLHSQILIRHSTYFAGTIEKLANEPRDAPVCHFFTIEDQNGKVVLAYQGYNDGASPLPSNAEPCSAPSRDGVKIKLEGEASTDTPDVVTPDPLKSYIQVLALFYNIQISTLNASITNTLILLEKLVQISYDLGCVPLVRPPLSKVLTDYRHDLFLAIKDDPFRWLKLGEILENKAIYAECLVHLVGAYPKCPCPSSRAAAWAPLSAELKQLIRKKSQAIDQLITEVERNLLAASLPYTDRPLDPTQPNQRETWLVVAVFRDYLAQQINALDPDHNRKAVLERGTFFRNLAKGAFEPLDGERLKRVCHGIMRAEWNDFSDDLHKLKKYAAEVASGLATNQLMIDPDAHGVGYVTCVEVTDEDYPWFVAQRTLAASSSVEQEGV